ncbi:MAG: RluA family pseudouridine synthase [Candidatus Binatus sp.]|uniref:RluA family pseudouridine synthase n=1 Tax=Candidatus Binatus sp. TaxID=2811406 RepID=UPI003BAEFED3
MPSREHQFNVSSRCELLPYLLTLPLGLSRKAAKDLLRFRAVTVSRMTTVKHDTRLEPGDVVTIAAGKQIPAASIERRGLKIVHLDDDIVVVDKAAGLLSMGSEAEKERTAHRILNDHLKALTGSPSQQAFIVHRLDRETSGLMMFARSPSIQAALQQSWKSVTKKYLAVVEGVPAKAEGTLRDNLEESKSLRMHRVERGGELAITHYQVLRKGRHNSLIELTLETGRKNQIRVQMAGLGHPIVGDRKYGATTDPARRLALHSCELKFRHPVSGSSMEFHSAMPNLLMGLIAPRGRD